MSLNSAPPFSDKKDNPSYESYKMRIQLIIKVSACNGRKILKSASIVQFLAAAPDNKN